MRKLTWRQAAAWRARRHYLEGRAPARRILAVASRICGLHAQVLSAAELALWARVDDLPRGAVQRALWKDRTLVKTWAMRGTLHLLPSSELPLWHAALGMNTRYRSPIVWQRLLGISLEEMDRLTEAIGTALDGAVLTREALIDEVAKLSGLPLLGKKLALNSWGTFLKPAAFTGRLCFAPGVGQRVCFTHPATWVTKAAREIDPQTVPATLTRRYLAAYGPATHDDFARWWGGAGMANIRRWIASLGDEVTPVEIAREKAWMLTADVGELALPAARSVRLLPAFDPYVVAASRHARHLLPGDFRARVYRQQGWLSPVLLVNGFIEGIWSHALKGSRVEVVIAPFRRIPPWVRRAAVEEASRLAGFFDGRLELAWKE